MFEVLKSGDLYYYTYLICFFKYTLLETNKLLTQFRKLK